MSETKRTHFPYVGREQLGIINIALVVLIAGLSINAFAGPSIENIVQTAKPSEQPKRPEIKFAYGPQDTQTKVAIPLTPNFNDFRRLFFTNKRILKVRQGDTLIAMLLRAGIAKEEAHRALGVLRSTFDPRDLRVGQKIILISSEKQNLEEIRIDPSFRRQISVRRDISGSFRTFENRRNLVRQIEYATGTIRSSLYKAAIKNKVPPSVLADLIRIYSWDVDFQREIKVNDGFELAYERFLDDSGKIFRNGNVIFARLLLSGKPRSLYRFEVKSGIFDYFDKKGRSAKRPLLRTPIDGARLSSRFGKRKHPILGYTKLHRGIDFAAPKGTPIFAAGDGIISYRGRKGAYGKYIRIRHAGRYSTAYAHLSKYRKGTNVGKRVIQGQIIGYVGSTGRSTGPHLHYEIIANNRQVNPLTIKMPSGIKLRRATLQRFQLELGKIDSIVFNLRKEIEVAWN